MTARRSDEPHRTATPLELFFDLVFVVAIATAAADLHHGIAENHVAHAISGYLFAFFGIWWAWVNFTWFASAYDTDDVPYRLLVLVQMTGALIFASGVSGQAEGDLVVGMVGYVVMRLALVVQWLRAASNDAERRKTALRYATGVSIIQCGWVALAFLPPEVASVAILFAIAIEMAVPPWAESAGPTTWHPHHIAERHGLLTIIVLGESVLAATGSIGAALEGNNLSTLLPTIGGGLLILYSMWWLYFEDLDPDKLSSSRRAFLWGYTHYFVYAAVAAVGAGLSIVTDVVTDHAVIGMDTAAWAIAIPVALYILCIWFLMDRNQGRSLAQAPGPIAAVLVLLTPFVPGSVIAIGVVLVVYLAVKMARTQDRPGSERGLERDFSH